VTDAAARSRDLERFDALFAAHQRAVLAYAMRRCANLPDAEDAAAETFTIAWRKLGAVPQDALPWLYAVARRVLANQRRGNGRRERLASVLRVADVATPMRVGDDRHGPAFGALASLRPADQEILRLVAWEELGNSQIARVLGITPNAVAIRLHRARARFAAALAAGSGGDSLKYPDPTRTSTQVKGTTSAASRGVAE
jgi:RNA polymerase sigma-70 factor (ECF subfamily)